MLGSMFVVFFFIDYEFPTWIGRRAPFEWPPKSLGLHLMIFFMWRIVKEKLCGKKSFHIRK